MIKNKVASTRVISMTFTFYKASNKRDGNFNYSISSLRSRDIFFEQLLVINVIYLYKNIENSLSLIKTRC